MGTSSSNPGSGPKSPLVPPWADKDGLGPGPEPEPHRFQAFRTSLGKFVASGGTDGDYLNAALGRYARTATGGHNVGPRRFGSMIQTGERLYDTMSALKEGRDPPGLSIAELKGRDTDFVIDILVQALVPDDGDADRVRVCLNEALSECLEGQAVFDPTKITDELIVDLLLAYVRNCVFGQIVLESNEAFTKGDLKAVQRAEKALRSLVHVAVDKHMRPLLSKSAAKVTGPDVSAAQREALREIWTEWEALD